MKSALVKAIAYICIGFAAGIISYHIKIDNFSNEINKLTSTDYSIESISYLSIATAIRNRNYDEALKFTEDMLSISVNSFADSGNAINSLSSFEKSTIEKVRQYREQECENKCLPKLLWIQSYKE